MRPLEDPCEECGQENGEMVLDTEYGTVFVCKKCSKKLRKFRKKVNHGEPPVE